MDRALVVLNGEDSDEAMLGEAAQYAAGADAELLTLMLITEEEWENDQGILNTIANEEHTSYENQTSKGYAETRADNIAKKALTGRSVSFEPLGAVIEDGERADGILEIAEEHNCDHVFLHGRRRSPAGKAIFGDTAQAVILNFDGYVTVSTIS
ncbi:universal stress protein [Haloprofundus salilacus]|uniref:universal stress protein n=1 Tax=Haloprofundus salilacus TaxID=2876190 RepID=UPI001CCF9727|nr:universal stress protein [Haloprofundus salilacus]